MKRSRMMHESIVTVALCLLVGQVVSWPAVLFRNSRNGYGRNIQPDICISNKNENKAGICMFAWDCMKANGTHLGTCIDRFYFGSCCKLNAPKPNDKENEIYSSDVEFDPDSPTSFEIPSIDTPDIEKFTELQKLSSTVRPKTEALTTEAQESTAEIIMTNGPKPIKAPQTTIRSQSTEAPKTTESPKSTEAPKTTESPKSTEVPKTTESPKSTETPHTTKVPKFTEAPMITKGKKSTEAPMTTEGKKSTEAPKTNKDEKSTEAPKTTEGLKSTEAPMTTKLKKSTEAPMTTKLKKSTEAPMITKGEKSTEAPMTTEGPISTEAPKTTEGLKSTEAPMNTKDKISTEAPMNTKDKISTEAPMTIKGQKSTEAPMTTKGSKSTEVPKTTEGLKSTEAPMTTKGKKSTEAPKTTEVPKSKETAKTTEAPISSKAPKTTEVPKSTETTMTTKGEKSTEAPMTTEVPEFKETPKTTEAPISSKAPKITEVPKFTEAPKTTGGPKSTEMPKTTEGPKSMETPKTTEGPKTTEVPSTIVVQKTTEMPKTTIGQKPTEAPKTTEGKNSTEEPKTTEVLKSTEAPKTTEVPKSTEAPKTIEVKKSTEAPKINEVSKSTEAPKTTEVQKSTEAPKTTEVPKSTEAPKTTKVPKSTEAPNTTEAPKSTKPPKTPLVPKSTEAPITTDVPKTIVTSRPAETVMPDEPFEPTETFKPTEAFEITEASELTPTEESVLDTFVTTESEIVTPPIKQTVPEDPQVITTGDEAVKIPDEQKETGGPFESTIIHTDSIATIMPEIDTTTSNIIVPGIQIITEEVTTETSIIFNDTENSIVLNATETPMVPVTLPDFDLTTILGLGDLDFQNQEKAVVEALKKANYKDICGSPVYPTGRIVGGHEASFGQWPWQVSLRQWRTVAFLHKCGAALVNENWAITAAHCVEGIEPDQLLTVMGEYDLGHMDEDYEHVERSVQVIAMHPKFEPRTFEYDLALLRFTKPIEFQPNIIPICIPEDNYDFLDETGYVTGWGRLYEDGPLPTVMQKVPVPIIPNDKCENMYKRAGYIEHIPNIFICAGYQSGKQDSCEGDSGGPMVIERNNRWRLAGVISWGIGCAVPNQPGVYTRISEFKEWVNKIIVF